MKFFSTHLVRRIDDSALASVIIINIPFSLRQTNLMEKENQYFSEVSALTICLVDCINKRGVTDVCCMFNMDFNAFLMETRRIFNWYVGNNASGTFQWIFFVPFESGCQNVLGFLTLFLTRSWKNTVILRLYLFCGEMMGGAGMNRRKKMPTRKFCPCVYISLTQITLWLFWINEAPGAKW